MKDDIAAIRYALSAGPTPGPWQDDAYGVHRVHAGRHRVILSINASDAQRETDAAYVAACHPERIARLLDALEAALIDAESWRRQHERFIETVALPASARIAELEAALESALRDAASWEEQANSRVDDALVFAHERDEARRSAAGWRENFEALQVALVGETGASGITVAHELRRDAERYRWLRRRQVECAPHVAIAEHAAERLDRHIDAAMKEAP